MASPSTVLKCLNEFSMNFNRKGDYVDTMAARWCKAFESTPDKALIAAVQAVCERTFTIPLHSVMWLGLQRRRLRICLATVIVVRV